MFALNNWMKKAAIKRNFNQKVIVLSEVLVSLF